MDGNSSGESEVVIRHATTADVSALTELRPPRGLHSDRIDAATKDYIVAEVDGKPAGFGVIYFHGDPMWERADQVPLVMDLWVAPNLRRRGIGSRMIQALEESARERGFPCVYIQVQVDKNPKAVELYR